MYNDFIIIGQYCAVEITMRGTQILKVRQNRKADWQAVDSPKNRTDEFDLFAVKSKKASKTNSSVRSLGEVSRP